MRRPRRPGRRGPLDSRPTGGGLDLDHGAFSHWRVDGRTALSRAQFWRLAAEYRRRIEADARVGDFALIVAGASVEVMALFAAMIAAGRTVSLFPPSSARQDAESYLEQQREAVLKIAPSSVIMLDDQAPAPAHGTDPWLDARLIRVPQLGEGLEVDNGPDGAGDACRDAFAAALGGDGRPLFWQHSSGTTGIKKAVGVTAPMLLGQFESYWPRVTDLAGGRPRVASWLPLYHDMGLLTSFLLPLLGGADIALMDPFDWVDAPGRFLKMIEQEGANICWMPNFAFRHYARLAKALEPADLGGARAWISCSEPCRYLDAVGFEDAFAGWGVSPGSVLGCYAMAETVFAVSQLGPGQQRTLVAPRDLRPGQDIFTAGAYETAERRIELEPGQQAILSSGPAIAGIQARVLVDGRPAARDGVYGEIGLSGGFVFGGYRAMTPAESGVDANGVYLTGDLGVIVGGSLYVLGRRKEVIIVNGKNIHAGDVEDRVGAVAGVRAGRVAAFGLENPRSGSEDLVVIAERDPMVDAPEAAIRAQINAVVSDAFLVKPHDVRIVAGRWLVKSTSGKVSRDRNRTKYLRDLRPDLR